MSGMRVLRLTLEYDGGLFHGWQEQPGLVTVQGELQRHLRMLLEEDIKVAGAGRTDAGVHALGQVASFRTHDLETPPRRIQRSLNALLRGGAFVKEIEEAPAEFHARRSAKSRRYFYLIAARPSPLWRGRVWTVTAPLSIETMKRAAEALPGTHDFTAFTASGGTSRGAECTVLTARWSPWRLGFRFDIEANRFLHHVVRSLVGTMVDCGRGRFDPSIVAELLASGDRTQAGLTAPARGLYFAEVKY